LVLPPGDPCCGAPGLLDLGGVHPEVDLLQRRVPPHWRPEPASRQALLAAWRLQLQVDGLQPFGDSMAADPSSIQEALELVAQRRIEPVDEADADLATEPVCADHRAYAGTDDGPVAVGLAVQEPFLDHVRQPTSGGRTRKGAVQGSV